MISAKVVADSINEFGHRITSLIVVFPRIVLAEAKTHRIISGLENQVEILESNGLNDEIDFSRNSASSRAIPFKKMVKMVQENPFIPVAWQQEHTGMQGTEYITDPDEIKARIQTHLIGRDTAIEIATSQSKAGVTKQLCNRYLEPFMWHTALITATEWDNFFKLRCPQYNWNNRAFNSRKDVIRYMKEGKDIVTDKYIYWKENITEWLKINKSGAEIHISLLAEAIWDAMDESNPKVLKPGEWHIPFGDNIDNKKVSELFKSMEGIDYRNPIGKDYFEQAKVKIATARCARTSYINYEGSDDYVKDINLYENLLIQQHMSPFEHCAQSMSKEDLDNFMVMENRFVYPGRCRNFTGWKQLRYIVETGKLI